MYSAAGPRLLQVSREGGESEGVRRGRARSRFRHVSPASPWFPMAVIISSHLDFLRGTGHMYSYSCCHPSSTSHLARSLAVTVEDCGGSYSNVLQAKATSQAHRHLPSCPRLDVMLLVLVLVRMMVSRSLALDHGTLTPGLVAVAPTRCASAGLLAPQFYLMIRSTYTEYGVRTE